MPRPKKKLKRKQNRPSNRDYTNYIDLLSTDELAIIFGYLLPENIMLARLNKKMRDAAIKTIVPIPKCRVNAFNDRLCQKIQSNDCDDNCTAQSSADKNQFNV